MTGWIIREDPTESNVEANHHLQHQLGPNKFTKTIKQNLFTYFFKIFFLTLPSSNALSAVRGWNNLRDLKAFSTLITERSGPLLRTISPWSLVRSCAQNTLFVRTKWGLYVVTSVEVESGIIIFHEHGVRKKCWAAIEKTWSISWSCSFWVALTVIPTFWISMERSKNVPVAKIFLLCA